MGGLSQTFLALSNSFLQFTYFSVVCCNVAFPDGSQAVADGRFRTPGAVQERYQAVTHFPVHLPALYAGATCWHRPNSDVFWPGSVAVAVR
jgi:hypothetical protein